MRNQKPPFEITNQTLNYMKEISGVSQGLQLYHKRQCAGTMWVSAATANRILFSFANKNIVQK